jgi:hypothetical protein
MTTGSTGTKRRTLLQRGFALLAGGAAIAGGSRWAAAASPATVVPARLTVYTRKGDVFDRPGGARIGALSTNTIGGQSAFGVPAATGLEMRALQLKEGTLFTVSGAAAPGTRALAIIGGTDRFAGRTGSCIERAIPGDHAADDMRELTITFAG